MRHPAKNLRKLATGAILALASVWAGCGTSPGSGFGNLGGHDAGGGGTADGGRGHTDVTVTNPVDSGNPGRLGGPDTGGGGCVHSTCAELNANCGVVTDKKCNSVVNCGSCAAGETCGAGGPSRCGSSTMPIDGGVAGDACVRETCASQSLSCGPASDHCGGALACGTCNAPQVCGGDPTKPGQCGCTGLCAQVATCSGTTTTDLIGTVMDPAGVNPLYNVLVYVPNDPTDPGLMPFAPGISCDICGATAAGNPLVTTYTAVNGTFTLKGVPTGTAVPVVIQLGRWRRQFTVSIPTSCAANSIPNGVFTMPKDHTEGDLPRIAIVTGAWDPVECALMDMGISQSEITNPGGSGYLNLYSATGAGNPYPGQGDYGPGAKIDGQTPTQDALYAATGPGPSGSPQVQPVINNYDMVILECEGYPEDESTSEQAALAAYLGAGGRVFGSHYTYDWFYKNPALQGAVNWRSNLDSAGGGPATATVDVPPTNPQGTAFHQWLETVGVTTGTTFNLLPAYALVSSVVAPTQEWLYTNGGGIFGAGRSTIQFTFNTPIGAPSAMQCGRATFNAWHAFPNASGQESTTFPAACGADTASSKQEKILEFMLFDLSACVQPYTPVCTPTTCASQGISCGPAGDGCGNLIQCGDCPNGQVCGGGGPGKCGNNTATTGCTPETCSSQGLACGPAGDGCGNEIQCGNCPTGQICGFSTPGQCGGSRPAVRGRLP